MTVSQCRVLQGELKRHAAVSRAGRATALTAPRTVLLKLSYLVLQEVSPDDPESRPPSNTDSKFIHSSRSEQQKHLHASNMHVP